MVSRVVSRCLVLSTLIFSAQGFVSPQIWSRIHSALRLYGNQPAAETASRIGVAASSSPLWMGRMGFGERMTRLRATASFGGFGDEELSYAELREQLGSLESQLAGAMEYGRYDEAKQLVSEITTLKDFMDKQAGAGSRNPFADAFGLANQATVNSRNGGLDTLTPKKSRTGLGAAFGSGVLGARRRTAGANKPNGLNREMWPQSKAKSAGDMPMEAVRKRHSDITAYGIRVEVFCFFQPGASRPQDNLYQFQCNIRITNTNPGDVQLLSRELKIFKADGSPPEYGPASQQLESQPTVGPGSVYMYMSEFGITCVPEDKKYLGRIEGHFNVAVKDENAVVKVPIAPFWLEIPGDTLVLA